MSDITEVVNEVLDQGGDKGKESKLNSFVALAVAIAATFMALCNIKDDNIVQAMAQAQAKAVDTWSYYQAKSTKQNLAEQMVDDLTLRQAVAGETVSAEVKKIYDDKLAAYREKVSRYEGEKTEIMNEAKGYQQLYDELNVHDDQFDLAEGALSVSIALLGVTALTQKKWLFGVGLAMAIFGLFFGMCGFLHLSVHLDLFAKLLG